MIDKYSLLRHLTDADHFTSAEIDEFRVALAKAERRAIRAEQNGIQKTLEEQNTALRKQLENQDSALKTQLEDKIKSLSAQLDQLSNRNSLPQEDPNRNISGLSVIDESGATRPLILGISDLDKKNDEAVHDALTAFEKKCPYCGKDQFRIGIRDKIEIDHFIPVSRGGQNVPWNLLPICKQCNGKKRNKLPIDALPVETYRIVSAYLLSVKNKYASEAVIQHESFFYLRDLAQRSLEFLRKNADHHFVREYVQLVIPEIADQLQALPSQALPSQDNAPGNYSKRVIEIVRKAGGSIDKSALYKRTLFLGRDRDTILKALLGSEALVEEIIKPEGAGRPKTIYRLVPPRPASE